jgi:hypothetical protein
VLGLWPCTRRSSKLWPYDKSFSLRHYALWPDRRGVGVINTISNQPPDGGAHRGQSDTMFHLGADA